MKLKWYSISVFLTAITLLVSCGTKKTGTESLVPKDAKVVMLLNAQHLMNKMAKSGINVDDMDALQDVLMDSSVKAVANFSNQTGKTGIDFDQPIVIAMNAPADDLTEKNGLLRFIIGIKNKDSFAAFIKKQQKGVKIEEGGINYATNEDDMLIGFNSRYAVIVQEVDENVVNPPLSNLPVKNQEKMSLDKKRTIIKNTFHLTKSKSILSNPDYNKLPITGSDIKIWADQDYAISKIKNEGQTVQLFTRMLKGLFEGSSSTTLLNFDNGNVNTTSQMYFSEEAAKVIKASASQNLDLSLLQNFPGATLNAVGGFSLNPSIIVDLAKYLKLDGLMNAALGKIQLNPTEVFNALTGEVVFALSDLKQDGVAEIWKANNTIGVILKVKDKAKLDKLLAIPDIASMLKKDGNNYIINTNSSNTEKTYMAINDRIMIISPNKTLVENYIAGTSKNSFASAALDTLKGKSAGYYFDINSISNVTKNVNFGRAPLIGDISGFASSMLSIFTNAQMTSAHFKDNYIETKGSLNLNKNSLNSLVYMVKSGVQSLQKEKESRISIMRDEEVDEEPIQPIKVK